jgi:plasmid stability protein
MGVLTVRDVDDQLIRELKIRAARHGRSAEAEHRLILEQALRPDLDALVRELQEHRRSLEGGDFSDMTDIIRRSRDSGWEE